jgi:hypothetical protein
MPTRDVPKKFLVAFSLAGEQRDFVRKIAEAVEQKLGSPNVFFDEWFEHYLAGGDADLKLQKLYFEKCELAVVCVSERYGGKPWTMAEYAAIRARKMKLQESRDESDQHRILPIRVGDGDVEGILFNTIAPDVRSRTPSDAAELIIKRLRLISPRSGEAEDPVPDRPEEPPMARDGYDFDVMEVLVTRLLEHEGTRLRISPQVPHNGHPKGFRIEKVTAEAITLLEFQNFRAGREYYRFRIPLSRIATLQNRTISIRGRVQQVLGDKWGFFDEAPATSDELLFGFGKPSEEGDPRVERILKGFEKGGYEPEFVPVHEMKKRLKQGWRIVYDSDGRYFRRPFGQYERALMKRFRVSKDLLVSFREIFGKRS